MKNLSCSIITFNNAINYGAVLQAYALKFAVSKYCYTFINRHICKEIKSAYSLSPLKARSASDIMRRIFCYTRHTKRNNLFKKFEDNYLIHNTPKNNNVIHITGSDQVWNYKLTNFDKAYFLDFVEDNLLKNAYSASFGIDSIPAEYVDEYKKLLSSFNNISVREKTGAKIIKDILGIDVPVTLDPTLLLDKTDWNNAFSCPNNIDGPYILIYCLGLTKTLAEFAKRLSIEKKLPIVVLNQHPLRGRLLLPKATYRPTASPEEWVRYFLDAECILTNSFHGTAFAVNFNKNFFTETLPPPAKVNSRITDLLEMLGLTNRLLFNGESGQIDTALDYERVNHILESERMKSLAYLKKIVESYHE